MELPILQIAEFNVKQNVKNYPKHVLMSINMSTMLVCNFLTFKYLFDLEI